jgi:hypothetical protein
MILLCGPTSRTSLPSAATGHCPARFGHRRHHNQAITVAPGRELEPTPPPPPLCHQSATTSTRRCLCSVVKSKREREGGREREEEEWSVTKTTGRPGSVLGKNCVGLPRCGASCFLLFRVFEVVFIPKFKRVFEAFETFLYGYKFTFSGSDFKASIVNINLKA